MALTHAEADPTIPAELITGLVLAGGQASRMGGVDKGLETFLGYPLVLHAVRRLAPQVGPLLINANRNQSVYEALGYPVIGDTITGFAGPLAGIHGGLQHAQTPYVLCVPCDSPYFPLNLAVRLGSGLIAANADVAYARTGMQIQPVFCIVRRTLANLLQSYLEHGGRKIESWFVGLNRVEVAFDDQCDAFTNINTREQLCGIAARHGGP